MIKSVPRYNGFDKADDFMSFFLSNLDKFPTDTIRNVMDEYNSNNQCTVRGRHSIDIKTIEQYLSDDSDENIEKSI